MARSEHGLLEEHGGIAECAVGLAHGLLEGAAELILRVDAAHAATASACDRFCEDREADVVGLGDQEVDVLGRGRRLEDGHAGRDRVLFRRHLVAGHLEHSRRRTDERDPGLAGGLGKLGVLGKEAVTRVDRVGAALPRDPDDLLHIQVRAHRVPRLADLVSLVCLEAVHRVAVLIREHSDRLGAQLIGGPEGPNCDFTAIGNEDLAEHRDLSSRGRATQQTVRFSKTSEGNVATCARTQR